MKTIILSDVEYVDLIERIDRDDAGPPGEGWQSTQLKSLLSFIKNPLENHLKIIHEALVDYRAWFDEEKYPEDTEKLKEIDTALDFIEDQQNE